MDGLTKMLAVFVIAFLLAITLALLGCLSATPVDVIREKYKPVGDVSCFATSERVRVCTDSRELSYYFHCEDSGKWTCRQVWK